MRVVEAVVNRGTNFNGEEILSTPKNLIYAAYAGGLIPEFEAQNRVFEPSTAGEGPLCGSREPVMTDSLQ